MPFSRARILVSRMLILLCLSILCLWFTICELSRKFVAWEPSAKICVIFREVGMALCDVVFSTSCEFEPGTWVLHMCVFFWEILLWNLQNLNALEALAHQTPPITSCFIILPKVIEKHHKTVTYSERGRILSIAWQNINCSVLTQQYAYVGHYLRY